MIVVDTNVASELMRPSPSPVVRDWVSGQRGKDLYTSTVTVAVIRYGIERLPAGRRKELLRAVADEIFGIFAEQVLPFDTAAAAEYAAVVSHRDALGMPIEGFDAQIAAICRGRGAALATRNATDFRGTGIDVIDPWNTDG